MARQSRAQKLRRLAAIALLAVGVPLGTAAQLPPVNETAPAAPQAEGAKPENSLPPISRDCQIGSAQIVSQTPLPNVERALRERQRIVIMVVGASPVALRNSASSGHYEVVEKLLEETFKGLDVSIVHRGVSAELVRDASERIKNEVALISPDLVLWQVGTADAMARMPVDEFEQTLTETLVWLRGHGVDVALIGLHYIKALTKDRPEEGVGGAWYHAHQSLRGGRDHHASAQRTGSATHRHAADGCRVRVQRGISLAGDRERIIPEGQGHEVASAEEIIRTRGLACPPGTA